MIRNNITWTWILIILYFSVGLNGIPTEENTNPKYATELHECERKCVSGETKVCHYHFHVEWYLTMSKACFDCPHNLTDCERPQCVAADGQRRQFISINRQIPGPKIEVCEGDTISAKFSNKLSDGRVMSVHWHGQHQAETPWMDGVPYVTQCPVLPGQDFTYEFRASPAGTFMYHSHVGLSLSDGMFGPLIVKQPELSDPNSYLYDHDCYHTVSGDCDHVLVMNDWTVGEGFGDFIRARWYSGHAEFSKSGLLNGRNSGTAAENILYPDWNPAKTPYPVFHVQQDKNYRFRVINLASTECRYRITVDSHILTTIATDGSPVKPFPVHAITIFPGERFDFVLNATNVIGNFWIKGHAIGECGDSASVYGILRYFTSSITADDEEPKENKDFAQLVTHLNPVIEEDGGDWGTVAGEVRVSDLQGYTPLPEKEPTHTFYIGMDEFTNNPAFNHPRYFSFTDMEEEFIPDTAVLNNISFVFPKSPFLYSNVPEDTFCDQYTENQDQCFQSRCHCTHRIKVPLGATVEMVLVNEMKGEGAEGHPIHLHGHTFFLLGMGKINRTLDKWDAKSLNDAGLLPKNLVDPPRMDTVQITGGGYAIIRFEATSPGPWLLHCHIQWHNMDGQAMIFQVGEHDEFPAVPDSMPRCGPYDSKKTPTDKDQCPVPVASKGVMMKSGFWCLLFFVLHSLLTSC